MTKEWVTTRGTLHCAHGGHVQINPRQHFVRVEHQAVLVARDPEDRPVNGCPVVMPKPCTVTLRVLQGYSTFIRIGGHRVVTCAVKGITDVAPPAPYSVTRSGQHLVTTDQ